MAKCFREFFGLVFSGFQAHPKNSRLKFTPSVLGIPLQFHFLGPKIISRRFSAYGGDQGFGPLKESYACKNSKLIILCNHAVVITYGKLFWNYFT